MNEARAKEILGEPRMEDHPTWPDLCGIWTDWDGGEDICLDGHFTAEELEAIAWWMRNRR
jgi:hypothetical protein